MFHNLKPPFTDPKVRQAFAYAIDREAWVRDVLAGGGSPTLTWIPKGFPGYDATETRWGYDPDWRARPWPPRATAARPTCRSHGDVC